MNYPPPIPNYPLIEKLVGEQSERVGRDINYLEIGVCTGGSAEIVLETGVVHFAVLVDTWGKNYGGVGLGSARVVAERLAMFSPYVLLVTGKSQAVLPLFDAQFDLIYVDGDHSPQGAGADLYQALRLLAPEGRILMDDVDNPAHKYLRGIAEKFAKEHRLAVEFHAIHTGMAVLHRQNERNPGDGQP